jgi:hypothetical protein
MFRAPNFNLLASLWYVGHTPSVDAPDVTDIPCQLYVNPRFSVLFITRDLMIRVPVDLLAVYEPGQIVEIPAASSHYISINDTAPMHQGFSNEYWALYGFWCDTDGNALSHALP